MRARNPNVYVCLSTNDVITAGVSDHHPIIHDGVLFWNVMMQGRRRAGTAHYNNGFGITETDKQYLHRLAKVAQVIAEIIYDNPDIDTIGLCEGPINSAHVTLFAQALKRFAWMDRFFTKNTFHMPNVHSYQNWGLLMLTDKKYGVKKMNFDFVCSTDIFDKLANRFQLWKLKQGDREKYFALGHFPFGGDEHFTEKSKFSRSGHIYCELINHVISQHKNKYLILCADFNFNPYLLKKWHDRALDQIPNNNSILLLTEEKNRNPYTQTVTVDGVLLSAREKQKYYTLRHDGNLSGRLISEFGLFKSSVHQYEEERYKQDNRSTPYTSSHKKVIPACF